MGSRSPTIHFMHVSKETAHSKCPAKSRARDIDKYQAVYCPWLIWNTDLTTYWMLQDNRNGPQAEQTKIPNLSSYRKHAQTLILPAYSMQTPNRDPRLSQGFIEC